eukprot:2617383-Pleurochrysis_carterae.AAC.1
MHASRGPRRAAAVSGTVCFLSRADYSTLPSMFKEHSISNLDLTYRVHGIGFEPATVISIRASEPDALRGVAYC